MSRFLNVTRWFKHRQPEPVMSTAEMRAELKFCTTALADARARLDRGDHFPLQMAEARLDLLAIGRRLTAIHDRLDALEGNDDNACKALLQGMMEGGRQ